METIVPNETGLLFHRQTAEAICDAIEQFEQQSADFDPEKIRAHATRFGAARFRGQFLDAILSRWVASGREAKSLSQSGCRSPVEIGEREVAAPGEIKELPVLVNAYPGKFAKIVAAVRAAIFCGRQERMAIAAN